VSLTELCCHTIKSILFFYFSDSLTQVGKSWPYIQRHCISCTKHNDTLISNFLSSCTCVYKSKVFRVQLVYKPFLQVQSSSQTNGFSFFWVQQFSCSFRIVLVWTKHLHRHHQQFWQKWFKLNDLMSDILMACWEVQGGSIYMIRDMTLTLHFIQC
jgi:hypothetical protein